MSTTVFETLADPTRRQLLAQLRRGERAVQDLVESVAIRQSGVSRHLRILREAGFVQVRAAGQSRLYSLRPERFQDLDAWLDDYRRLWEERLENLGAELEHRQRLRTNDTRGASQ